MEASLVEMKPGQTGVISRIQGGSNLVLKLNQLGLREGKQIKKISSVFNRGPVTINVDNYQVAVGYGKAVRIMVEVEGEVEGIEKNSPGR